MMKPLSIECRHGIGTAAIVCRHHVSALDRVVGFVENSSDPHDLQAWCDDCEAYFSREGELTEAFKRFNDFAVVCVACYSELKAKHSRGPDGVTPWPFSDPKDLGVIVLESFLTGRQPVVTVHHEVFDGSWQFLTDDELSDDMKLVRLAEVVQRDETLQQLWDLPLGWYAERPSQQQPWTRHPVFPREWEDLLAEAQAHTQACRERLETEHALGDYPRYDYDQEAATLVFSGANRPNLSMDIQIVGSWAAKSGTWLWAWENDSILPSAKQYVHVLRKYGEQNGFERLSKAYFEASQADGWEMACVACLLLQADGVYRAPDEDGALFMLVSDPVLVEA